jgi:hypothetical protein
MSFTKVRKKLRKLRRLLRGLVKKFYFLFVPTPYLFHFLHVYFFITQLKKKDKNVLHNKKYNTKHVLATVIPSPTPSNPISNLK